MEDHHVVDPVQKLRAELAAKHLEHLRLHALVALRVSTAAVAENDVGADVRSHHDDRVLEIDRSALAIGQTAIVEDLEQRVEDVGVCLLDLVEEDHRIGLPANCLGELPPFIVADVSRRSAHEPGNSVLLHVLGHVQADHVRLVVEKRVGERAGDLGLPDPRWVRGR